MMNRQERQALAATHKAAVLEKLNHRMEAARRKGDKVLLQQLEAEEKYINAQPIPLNLQALLSPLKAQKSRHQKHSWGTLFSKFWATFTLTKTRNQ